MPNDNFEDDSLEQDQGGERGDNARRKRPPAGRLRHEGTPPPLPPLSLGMSHQIELLLAARRHRLRNLGIRLGIFVLLPTFVVWFYAALIATPRYVCNFDITYQTYQPDASLAGGLTQSDVGSSSLDSIDYGTLLYEYIRSQALAEKVDSQIGVRAHFSSSKIDPLSRLAANASQESFLAYWRSHVSVDEGFGGYLTIEVQGFDPDFTLRLAQTVAADADAMIDGLSNEARKSEVQSALDQVNIAAAALKQANTKLTQFRNAHGDLDPSLAATQIATIVGTLEGQLASLQAQLQQAEANMQPGAAQIVQLKLQVDALQQQIATQRDRLSDSTGTTYSNTVAQYQNLVSDQQFANTTFQSAEQGLVIARADAAAKQNYVVAFVKPTLPGHPTLPDPTTSSLTTFLVFLSLYGICNLLFAAFRDQSGV